MTADTEKTKGKQKNIFFLLNCKKKKEPHKAVINIDKITGE